MARPIVHDQHIPCPVCKLMDYYVLYNEVTQQSWIACQNCGAEFIRIQWVPQEMPDPTVVI